MDPNPTRGFGQPGIPAHVQRRTDEPSPWELDRRLGSIERSINDGFRRLDDRLDKMVSAEVFAQTQRATEQRINGVDSTLLAFQDRVSSGRNELDQKIDKIEEARAHDRRNMIRVGVGAAVSIVAALLSFFFNYVQSIGGI